MQRVIIFHGYTTSYRIPFFKELYSKLLENNIELKVVVGQPPKGEYFGEIDKLPFFIFVRNKYFYILGKIVVWEPVLRYLKHNDLIIIRQANKHLVNPLIFIYSKLFLKKIAMWGNLKNYLFNNKKIKNPLILNVDHWFAYNDVTKRILIESSYSEQKITSVNNSIDTQQESELYERINENEILSTKKDFGISQNDIVGLFCSRFYADKRIDFLLEAVQNVKVKIRDFKFIVIGSGEEVEKIKSFSNKNKDWFFYVGSKYGVDKIELFKISDFQLIPGAVGLHIVDSFALQTPVITTYSDTHGVEIEYLANMINGVICENSIEKYVESICRICENEEILVQLKKGCYDSSKIYSVKNMADRFANGIISCLN